MWRGYLLARILIVDDAKFMIITLSEIIISLGHEVVGEASCGAEAIEKYKQLCPDIITLDITMPNLSGIDALRQIKKIDSSAKIIMCSAMGQNKTVIEALGAGAKDFITKPFERDRVKDAINRLL
ncbi:MAG: two-component system response regulator [Bacillales bacterium]|nr:two-component system response regulator [Bacillales bacterium]